MVESSLCNARDTGSISGQGTKIPHATGQQGLCATTAEPVRRNERARMPTKQEILQAAMKILHAATKNQHSETNFFLILKKDQWLPGFGGKGERDK